MEILDYKEKLQKDPKVAEQFKKEQEKPVPKLSVWHIPVRESLISKFLETLKRRSAISNELGADVPPLPN